MVIEILGIGDARSDELEAAVREALEPGLRDAGVTVRRFDDPARMIARGVRRFAASGARLARRRPSAGSAE